MEISTKSYDGRINIRISDKRIQENLVKAQRYLDNVVLTDCNKYVPFRSGKLRQSGINNTVIGSGEVQWRTPYAHFQHEGKTMVGIQSRSPFAAKGEPKEYDGGELQYHTEGTGPKWFEKGKRLHGKDWIKGTKKIAGGK